MREILDTKRAWTPTLFDQIWEKDLNPDKKISRRGGKAQCSFSWFKHTRRP